jgi:hypothetical protein
VVDLAELKYMDVRKEVADVLLEYLEAVTHQLLHLRQLYKSELFERQRLYGITVRKSRHPKLNNYINDVISSLKVGDPGDAGSCLLNSALLHVPSDIS